MRPDTKQCPECGEEFLPSVASCSDCGVPLRLAAELAAGADGGGGLPPIGELVLIRAEGPAWIEALADRLRAEEIPSRVAIIDPARHGIESGLSGSACGLFVRADDAVRAREIDAHVQQEQIPDLPVAGADEQAEGCPACGHPAPADAAECPDCGLHFG
ncbi:MAG: hypothetical protein HKP30_17335 [Myxococcales bacterium]|nr:hypothetical protein [Myxococcales bacterium]